MGRLPKWMRAGIQIVLSLMLLWFVLRQIDFASAVSLLKKIRHQQFFGVALAGALVLFNLSKVASAYRLNIYQRSIGVVVHEADNLRLYYAGMFLNLFLPGGIGGDGFKVMMLRRRFGTPFALLIKSALADRLNGLIVLLGLLCLLWLVPSSLFSVWLNKLGLDWSVGFITCVVVALAGIVILTVTFIYFHRWQFIFRQHELRCVFAFGLAVQLLQLATIATLLCLLQVQPLALLPFLTVFLISSVAAVLPLSAGGLGIREVTFFYGMKLLMLDPLPGVMASSAFFFITLLSSVVGVRFLGERAFKSESSARD